MKGTHHADDPSSLIGCVGPKERSLEAGFLSPAGAVAHLGACFTYQTLNGAGQAFGPGFRITWADGGGWWLLTLVLAPFRSCVMVSKTLVL